ncbi:MAG TPA: hypothetical protein PLM07_10470 [Candidatus Rifleibacterium sp.]|nr:hypothetical protein [Candidatus Rifleibacterium sp.]HPT46314.1 hypothetical protein [Candidatus Rifleibacterium sp.]
MELNVHNGVAGIDGRGLPSFFAITAVIGFAIIGFSTSMNFTPAVAQNWRSAGVGLPVMISCILGAFLMFRRDFFSGFFITIFAGFFLTHEIIIIYDNKAVELGQELGVNGWFRPVMEVYRDAFSFNTGAFWALVGVLIALVSVVAGGMFEVVDSNRLALQKATSKDDDLTPSASGELMAEAPHQTIESSAPESVSEEPEENFADNADNDEINDAGDEDHDEN